MNPQAYLDRLRDDFVFFMEQVWIDRRFDRYAKLGWVERDILRWIQRGPTRSGVLAWRGIGKTHLVTAGITSWELFRNPNAKVLIVSKSESEAKKTLSMIRNWIDNIPFLQHLIPVDGQRDSATQFDVAGSEPSRDPSVCAKGIDGQVTGTRASRIIADDIETKNNTQTIEARTELNEKVKELSAIASYGERRITYVGTYHHEESLYLKLAERGYRFRTWPMLYPQATDKILDLAPSVQKNLDAGVGKPGQIVADYRISPDFVAEKQSEGVSYFAMQYQLISNLGDEQRYPLRLEDLIVFPINRDKCPISIAWGKSNGQGTSTRITDISSLGFGNDALYAPIMYDLKWGDYQGTKMWIDPSGRGADLTGYAIVAYGYGYLWVKACGGLQGGYSDTTLSVLCNLARQHLVNEIYLEDNFGQGAIEALMIPVLRSYYLEPGADPAYPQGWKASTQTVRVTSQKETRIIESLEPVLNQHRLVIDRTAIDNPSLQRQLTRITRDRNALEHDDELESLAMCCHQWNSILRVSQADAAEKHRQKLIDDQLEEMRRLAGSPSRRPAWFVHH